MNQRFDGPVEQVAAGNIINHFPSNHCPGLSACPYRLPPQGDRDAKEENEFFRDTGIRAGTRARALLSELKGRHGHLKWHGIGSVSRMWKHRSIEYIDGSSQLRINPSRLSELNGWFVFGMAALMMLVFIGILTIRPKPMTMEIAGIALAALLLGIGGMWVSAEHLISPERAARRLLKLETNDPVPSRY